MAFLMSFPRMLRSKVGEMKFSMPQSLLAGRGKGAQGDPATLSPTAAQGRAGQRHQAAQGLWHPLECTASCPCLWLGAGTAQCALRCRMAMVSHGFTGGNSQPA